HRKSEADARAKQGLLDMILDRNHVEVPESLVMREQRAMENDLASTLRQGGLPDEQVAERVNAAAEELKSRAHKRATTALVLDALSDQEKVSIDDDELADRIGAILRQTGGKNRERMSEFYAQEENREGLRLTMRREKVLDQLLSRAQRTDEAPAPS